MVAVDKLKTRLRELVRKDDASDEISEYIKVCLRPVPAQYVNTHSVVAKYLPNFRI